MKLQVKEIEFILYLFPYAHKKFSCVEYKEFYAFICDRVNHWFTLLNIQDKRILELRYFYRYTLEQISTEIGYQNHSSINRSINKILVYIQQSE